MRSRISRRRRVGGFTLVELMVVVAIIGLLAAVVTVNVMGQSHTARVERVRADMRAIGDACDLFKIACGTYPQQLQDLWERPSSNNARKWAGPYLKEYPPKDPWGNDYIYNFSGGGQYEIICYGADGGPGGVEEGTDLSSKTINNSDGQ